MQFAYTHQNLVIDTLTIVLKLENQWLCDFEVCRKSLLHILLSNDNLQKLKITNLLILQYIETF